MIGGLQRALVTFPLDRRHRRIFEIGIWIAYVAVVATVGATSTLIEYQRSVIPVSSWEPFVWEYSAGIVALALVPAVLALEKRAPFTLATWPRMAMLHFAATLPFSITHIAGMVLLREGVYALAGRAYEFASGWADLGIEFLYEWRKDVLSYFFIIAAVNAYRLLRARLDGAAAFEPPAASQQAPVSFEIRRGDGRSILAAAAVDWVEAAGNYVILHAGGKTFPLRDTMKNVEARLDADRFARVHRSAIVNIERVEAVETKRGGDRVLRLATGEAIPVSRRYAATASALLDAI